jgi:hypothetical protein
MNEPQLIAAPTSEPVTLSEIKLQLGFGPEEDSTREASSILSDKLGRSYSPRAANVNRMRGASLLPNAGS